MAAKKNFGDTVLGVLPGLVISVITSVIVFSGSFSALNAKVDAQEEAIKHFVPREEHDQVRVWQERYQDTLNKRLDKLEDKIDDSNKMILELYKRK